MESTAIDAVNLGGSAIQDMSVWGLFLQADFVVKAVMLLLLFASFWSWAIIFDKVLLLRRLNGRTSDFEDAFWSGDSLEALYEEHVPHDPTNVTYEPPERPPQWRHITTSVPPMYADICRSPGRAPIAAEEQDLEEA